MVSSCGLRTFAGRCLLRRQFLCQLVSTHGVLMRLPGEFVSGQMISLGTGDSGGVGVHDQVLRLVVCACSVVSCRPYRGRSHNLSSKRAPCYDDSDCRNCSKLHTDKKSVPRLSMLLHLCVAAPANLSRSAIAKQFVHAKCQRGDISRVKCAGWHLNTDITARGCGESVSIKRLNENFAPIRW
jgi:hypothetical protein